MVALVLIALAAHAPAPADASEVHSFRATQTGVRTLDFATRGIRPKAIARARLRVGSFDKRLSGRAVRGGFAVGHLRVRVSVRTAVALRHSRARIEVRTRDFPAYDGYSTLNGTLRRTRAGAYDGPTSISARYGGTRGISFQRVWRDVHWGEGSDVWYGMALKVPDTSAYCYWNPMRWDNYKTFQDGGDVGGLAVEGDRMSVIRNDYGGTEQKLIEGVAIPKNRWFWVEVHQRLSSEAGLAFTELFIDGRSVGSSVAPNTRGREIDTLRYGVVNVASSCSRPGTVLFDRTSLGDRALGPRSGPPARP